MEEVCCSLCVPVVQRAHETLSGAGRPAPTTQQQEAPNSRDGDAGTADAEHLSAAQPGDDLVVAGLSVLPLAWLSLLGLALAWLSLLGLALAWLSLLGLALTGLPLVWLALAGLPLVWLAALWLSLPGLATLWLAPLLGLPLPWLVALWLPLPGLVALWVFALVGVVVTAGRVSPGLLVDIPE